MSVVSVIENELDQRQINVEWPVDRNNKAVTVFLWAERNLKGQELDLWRKCHNEHERAVETAVKNGDANIEKHGPDVSIHWVSTKKHKEYMNLIDQESKDFYHEIWTRFLADREAISASFY